MELQEYSNGCVKNEMKSLIEDLTDHQEMLERLSLVQSECEESLLSIRRQVQSYVGSNISSSSSIIMLNIDTQLGVVMVTLSQVSSVIIIIMIIICIYIGKKRLSALEQVSEVIHNKVATQSQEKHEEIKNETIIIDSKKISEEDTEKTDEDYIAIIDQLTKNMFDYKVTKSSTLESSSTITTSIGSGRKSGDSEYERVMKTLDQKLRLVQSESRDEMRSVTPSSGSVISSVKKKQVSVESIDKLFGPPDKIVIPERYQPVRDMLDTSDDDDMRREKSESVKKLLVNITGHTETELEKNRDIARLAVSKGALLASAATDHHDDHDNDDESERDSPEQTLPTVQQRDSFIL